MEFSLADALPLLRITPDLLKGWLLELPDSWITANEGSETWSPYDVVGHLIHGERTDWMPRVELLLKYGQTRPFTPFNRFAQFQDSKGKSLGQLIDTFAELRRANLESLVSLDLTPNDLERRGLHPELGPVSLGELLATWVVHDLNHIGQIARVMSRQYQGSVGPWVQYLPILTR